MPHVTVRYKMHVPAGHRRRPRSNAADLTLAQPAGSDVPNPGTYTPPFFAHLPYDLGGNGLARLLFWNVTDGTNGQVLAPTPFDQAVAEYPLTITAWYVPVTGPALAEPGIIGEAFSAALGKFVDDTFVTVTSNPAQVDDPALTGDANVIGFIPTDVERRLQARLTLSSTTEPFGRWILNDTGMPLDDAMLMVKEGDKGIAVAVYQTKDPVVTRPRVPSQAYYQAGILIGGVVVDGGGNIIIGGVPHPIDPLGPLMVRIAHNAVISVEARGLERTVSAQVQKLAAQDALAAVKDATPALEKQLR
jgi:hypothetical protein